MTSREYEIVKVLADGNCHSGQELAERVGISRTAIWKHLKKIRGKQIDVLAVRGKGYQLSGPVELLDKKTILKYIKHHPGNIGRSKIEVFYSLGSTNRYLLDELNSGSIHSRVLLSEHQTEGRGRANNRWESGLGAGIYMSIGWHYPFIPKSFPALSLALGVVISNCISEMTGKVIGLKWPNDLFYDGSKLGGILIESRGQHAGSMDLVVGIGVNFRIDNQVRKRVGQAITDLKSVQGKVPSRNEFAAILITNIFELLSDYPDRGFTYYLPTWKERDIGKGKTARLEMDGANVDGDVAGVDEEGNLIMNVKGKLEKYTSGNLSLRFIN